MKTLAKKINKTKNWKEELFLLFPVLVMVTFFLFAVRVRLVPTYQADCFWYSGEEMAGDLYAYFRMEILIALMVVFGIYMIFCIATKEIKLRKHLVYIPMVLYVVLVIVSYACSEYKEVALYGALERNEGTVTLLCYMGILFYSMYAIRSEKSVSFIMKCFSVACCLLGIYGIVELTGHRLEIFPDWMIMPSAYRGSELVLNSDTKAINWFFSNQNYTSFFMIFPICLFAMSCISAEDKKKKLIYAALTGFMMFSLWQAASLGGMVGLAVAVVVAFFVVGFENIKKWKKSLGLLVLAGIISIGASMPVIMREVQSGAETSLTEDNWEEALHADLGLRFVKIDHIITDGPEVIFSFEGEEVTIVLNDEKVEAVVDSEGKPLAKDNELVRTNSYYHEESGYMVHEIVTANRVWSFVLIDGQSYYISISGQGVQLDEVESIGFENNQHFATNRGYVWSRTLPILKDTMIYGKGADTFVRYFPHEDYAGRYNIGYYKDGVNTIFDKPHNMYLGAAVNTGVVSMVALIAIYVIYLIESARIYRKHSFNGFKDYIGMGIFIAIAGFVVAGIVNDSTVQMMPVVYTFLGMGFAINWMLKDEK